jgi:hypothetical protein
MRRVLGQHFSMRRVGAADSGQDLRGLKEQLVCAPQSGGIVAGLSRGGVTSCRGQASRRWSPPHELMRLLRQNVLRWRISRRRVLGQRVVERDSRSLRDGGRYALPHPAGWYRHGTSRA